MNAGSSAWLTPHGAHRSRGTRISGTGPPPGHTAGTRADTSGPAHDGQPGRGKPTSRPAATYASTASGHGHTMATGDTASDPFSRSAQHEARRDPSRSTGTPRILTPPPGRPKRGHRRRARPGAEPGRSDSQAVNRGAQRSYCARRMGNRCSIWPADPDGKRFCTGMSLPDCGEQQISALMSRGADLRKRGHLDTRTVYLDQCFIRSSRAGFVDHAGHELRNPGRPVSAWPGCRRTLRSSCAGSGPDQPGQGGQPPGVFMPARLLPAGGASAPMHRP